MFLTPALKKLLFLLFLAVFLLTILPKTAIVLAQTPTPAPINNTASWGPDPDIVVTEVGRNADRARQLLWWVFQHPGIHAAPVIASLWGFSRNIVYVFLALVIVAFGLSLILGKRRGTMGPIFSGLSSPVFGVNVPTIFIKIAILLLYVTFSYLVIIALIQTSDIVMKFFIENVGGKDLFNIIFAGAGNSEENYKTFVGFRDNNILHQEMVNTSLFIIRFTSFTYYVMAIIIILRTMILWFLLIISPFLALLIPFVFIRNTGWIWIGVFLQWLFYGPLFALFLASLTRIWVSGIPYGFDFGRVNTPQGQVYQTAINILYGGPAQTLSPGNSSNYVDTFAEYVIALVMLWAAILLPWLLLRIFRDYCCAMITASQNTLSSIFDRIRQYPVPPVTIPPVPSTTTGIAVELPFRQRIEEKVREVQITRIEDIKDVQKTTTTDIARSIDMSVSRLSDISRYELNQERRSEVQKYLNKIGAPEKISTTADREKFMSIREELTKRAEKGDLIAQSLLTASETKTENLVKKAESLISSRSMVTAVPGKAVYAPSVTMAKPQAIPTVVPQAIPAAALSQQSIQNVARTVNVPDSKVKEVLEVISKSEKETREKYSQLAQTVGLSESKIVEITQKAQSGTPIADLAKTINVPESQVREVLQALTTFEQTDKERQRVVAAKVGVPDRKVREIVEAAMTTLPKVEVAVSVEDFQEVKEMWLKHYLHAPVPETATIKDRKTWLTEEEKKLVNIANLLSSSSVELKNQGMEKVAEILPFMLLGGFSDKEMIAYINAKLAADRQVQQELTIEEKAKEAVKKEIEEEETLVELEEKKVEQKEMVKEEDRAVEMEQVKKDNQDVAAEKEKVMEPDKKEPN